MDTYRVTLGAMTNSGRWLIQNWVAEVKADEAQTALAHARREFFQRTGLVSGVRVETQHVEQCRNTVSACRALPGTWIRLEVGWRRVDHWEPYSYDECRLFTTDPREPYAGIYDRWHTFQTR